MLESSRNKNAWYKLGIAPALVLCLQKLLLHLKCLWAPPKPTLPIPEICCSSPRGLTTLVFARIPGSCRLDTA